MMILEISMHLVGHAFLKMELAAELKSLYETSLGLFLNSPSYADWRETHMWTWWKNEWKCSEAAAGKKGY